MSRWARLLPAILALAACGDNRALPAPADAPVCPACDPCQECRAGACVPAAPVAAAALALGWTHSLALDDTGGLHGWGANGNGQLGVGDLDDRLVATPVMVGSGWRSIAGGSRHSCGVRDDGTLWCWGVNVHGQLGLGDTDLRTAPAQVPGAGWADVACGGLHTCARTAGGALWCFGSNPVGQLGLGDVTGDQPAPQQVGGPADWTAVFARARTTCGLRADRSLWCWGDDSDGQAGHGDPGDAHRAPRQVTGPAAWTTVGPGSIHTCAIDVDGALWCWGDNQQGQLGLGDQEDRAIPTQVGDDDDWLDVSSGWSHTCGLRADGGLWCWGANAAGQLGLGGGGDRSTPVRVAGGPWIDVAAGGDHTCARALDGEVRCWGDNAWGQLATGDRTPASVAGRTCAVGE